MASDATVLAAVRWLRELQTETVESASSRFRTLPRYVDLTPTQYQAGLDLLRDLNLDQRQVPLALALDKLLAGIWAGDPPIWMDLPLAAFDSPDELPIDLSELSDYLDIEEFAMWNSMRKFHGKVDSRRAEEIGAFGEQAFVDWLAANALKTARVVHVSTVDDGAGYDVAVSDDHAESLVEIKSSTWATPFSFHLSRNELSAAMTLEGWQLQLLHMEQARIVAMYWVSTDWVKGVAPRDTSSFARWDSFRATPPPAVLRDGLHPGLRWALDDSVPTPTGSKDGPA